MIGKTVEHTVSLPAILSGTVSVAAHGIAVALFLSREAARPIVPQWPAQFITLAIVAAASLFLLSMRHVRSTSAKIALVTIAVLCHVLMGVPSTSAMQIHVSLASAFVPVAMSRIGDRYRIMTVALYGVVVILAQRFDTAWGIALYRASWMDVGLFAAYIVFIAAVVAGIGSQQAIIAGQRGEIDRLDQTIGALSEANLTFQEYATSVERRSAEEERKRIAREVHDLVGYALTNLHMMLQAALDIHTSDQIRLAELLSSARDQTQAALFETRRALRELREIKSPASIGKTRLRELIRSFQSATGTQCDISYDNTPPSLGEEVDDLVYRTVQEGLTNSFRHGRATWVTISLQIQMHVLSVTITDNGTGAKQITPGIGMNGMHERLAKSGGTLTYGNVMRGFRIRADIPLATEEHTSEED